MWQSVVIVVVVGVLLAGCGKGQAPPPARAPAEWWKTFHDKPEGSGETELVRAEGKIVSIVPEEQRMVIKTKKGKQTAWWDVTTVIVRGGQMARGSDFAVGEKVEYRGSEMGREIYLRRLIQK